MNSIASAQHFVPSPDVVTSIVIPTIVFCIGMVVAMLIGINKCKQWELDKIVEMRRTRRVIQRITARLREKNFRTIQKARNMRKRAVAAKECNNNNNNNSGKDNNSNDVKENAKNRVPDRRRSAASRVIPPPPLYCTYLPYPSGNSPPPTYEDSLLDQLYHECMPSEEIINNATHKVVNNNRRRSSAGTSKSFRK